MKAAIVPEPGLIEIMTVPDPVPGPYEVLVETIGCGFCNGTDTKIVEGHWPGTDPMPYILGHEAVGKIVELGAKVRNLKLGDIIIQSRVEGYPDQGIGTAWGGFVEYSLASDWKTMLADGLRLPNPFLQAQQVVPQNMNPVDAMMLITAKEVYSALQGFNFRPGMDLLIFGDGPVGICMGMCARQMGAGKVILCGHHEDRLALAIENGASHVVNPRKTNLQEFVKSLAPDGLPLIVDAIGNNNTVQLGLKMIADEGHIGIYGYSDLRQAIFDWSESPVRWSIDYLVVPQLSRLVAAHDPLSEWIMHGQIQLGNLVTHQIPFDHISNAFDLIQSRKALKVFVNIRPSHV